eukprot:403364233
MIVESTYMQKCGEGTPMFSRRGKSTSVQYMVFNTPNLVVESSFKKELREKEGSNNQYKHERINELDTIFEQFKVYKHIIIYNFNAQIDQLDNIEITLKRQNKQKVNPKANLQPVFKSVTREQSAFYKINRPTVALNDGMYDVNYSLVTKKEQKPDIAYHEPNRIKPRSVNMPFCIQNNHDCSYQSRVRFKQRNQNSSLNNTNNNDRLSKLQTLDQAQINLQNALDMPQYLNASFAPEDKLGYNEANTFLQRRDTLSVSSPKLQQIDRNTLNATTNITYMNQGSSVGTSPFRETIDYRTFMSNSKISAHIKSPLPFDKVSKRLPITKGMIVNDERFTSFNTMPAVMSKYTKSPSPDFSKAPKGSLDSILLNSSKQDNAQNQSYHPNHEFLLRPLTLGIPDFKRYVSREQQDLLEQVKQRPDNYDHDKVSKAFSLLSDFKRPKQQVKFETIPGRNDSMYKNLEKKEVIPDSVSFNEFLPNHMRNSPQKKSFSHSNTTQKFNLRRYTQYDQFNSTATGSRKSEYMNLDATSMEEQLYKTKLISQL